MTSGPLKENSLESGETFVEVNYLTPSLLPTRQTLSEEANLWYRNHQGMARSLKEIARLAVRNISTNKLESFLLNAEIPKSLKQYVYFLLE